MHPGRPVAAGRVARVSSPSDPGRKPRVAVVFGGRSSEHSISCISAGSVIAALDPEKYDVVPVGIAPDGRWVLESDRAGPPRARPRRRAAVGDRQDARSR